MLPYVVLENDFDIVMTFTCYYLYIKTSFCSKLQYGDGSCPENLWVLSHFLPCIVFSYIRSVAQSCPTLCNPMNRSMPGLPVHHQLPEFTETHVHQVSDAIQPSHPLSFPSPPAPNPSQHQSLFQ